MGYYCSTSDVGSRIGLNSAQSVQAGNRLTYCCKQGYYRYRPGF